MGVLQRERQSSVAGAIAAIGLGFVAAYVAALFVLMDNTSWETWGAMFVGPVLFVASLPALARQARREGESRVFWVLVAALAVKMLVSLLRYHHAFNVVDAADARAYDRVGSQIALRFLDGDFNTGLPNLLDSNFIRFFTALIYATIRPSVVSGFLIYAWLAFWGTYFFYRAFVIAVPEGNRRSYARWLFFLPSMLFWPSSIGKESWMLFALGLAAFGAAKALSGRVLPGVVVSGIGIGLASLVRAPIAVALGIGLVVGGLLRRPSSRLRQLTPVAKLGSVALFVALATVLVVTMERYIVRAEFEGSTLDTLVLETQQQTSQGGSEFTPTPVDSPLTFVVASVTVMFRPFMYEAHTLEAVVTSVEASLLLIVSVIRFRSFAAALRSIRRTPYVAAAIVYVTGSIFALSPVANFGIIARQRVLIFPMYLVAMCFASARARVAEEGVPGAGVHRTATVGSRS